MSDVKAVNPNTAKLDEILAKLDALSAKMDARPGAAARPPSDGQARFGNYGRSKGGLVAGATAEDLRYYGDGCRRTLSDESKSRFHDRERELLAAIEAEETRQGLGATTAPQGDDSIPF